MILEQVELMIVNQSRLTGDIPVEHPSKVTTVVNYNKSVSMSGKYTKRKGITRVKM